MIDTIFQYFKEFFGKPNMWYNLATTILAVGAFIYSIIKDYIQNKKKQPTYWLQTTHLVRETAKGLDGLSIRYKGREISDLSSTKFILWNKGRDAIKRSDVASKSPIKITIDSDYEILDAFIDKMTDEDNNIKIRKQEDGKSVIVDFEFLDYNDGLSMVITHTAPSSDNFKVTGKVISGSKIEYDRFASYPYKSPIADRESSSIKSDYYLLKTMSFVFGLFFIIYTLFRIKSDDVVSIIVSILFMSMGFFLIYFGLFVLRRRIPQKLEN